jgi:hypothetical protein
MCGLFGKNESNDPDISVIPKSPYHAGEFTVG